MIYYFLDFNNQVRTCHHYGTKLLVIDNDSESTDSNIIALKIKKYSSYRENAEYHD